MSLDNYTSKTELLNGLRRSEVLSGRQKWGISPERSRFVILCNIHCHSHPAYTSRHDVVFAPSHTFVEVTDYNP
jgi:hypothetical protein